MVFLWAMRDIKPTLVSRIFLSIQADLTNTVF